MGSSAPLGNTLTTGSYTNFGQRRLNVKKQKTVWTLDRLRKAPQWGTTRLRENPDAPLALVGLDPAGQTGWSVQTVSAEEPVLWHGQCALEELAQWVGPLVQGHQCLVVVERGFVGPSRSPVSLKNTITLMERIGRVCGWVEHNVDLAGPVWRPIATQWRAAFPGWVGKVKGREAHKARAVLEAGKMVGEPIRKLKHQTENGRRVAKETDKEDEADALCMVYAGLRLFNEGGWPLWHEVDEHG